MVIKKININLLDLFVVSVLLMIGIVLIVSCGRKTNLGSEMMTVEITVRDIVTLKNIESKLDVVKQFYYGGSNFTVNEKSYELQADGSLKILVEGLGNVESGKSIFLGQRIYNNQKVELRGDYFVQGYVTDYYEN